MHNQAPLMMCFTIHTLRKLLAQCPQSECPSGSLRSTMDEIMLFENPQVNRLLRAIICHLTHATEADEDLMQEAVFWLWYKESKSPGQKLSWYLQACLFHIQRCRHSGRSVDSPGRRHLRTLPGILDNPDRPADADELVEASLPCEDTLLSEVSEREDISILLEHLPPRERQILLDLEEELEVGEIASKRHLSRHQVLRLRKAIASVAIKWGIEPLVRHRIFRRAAV